MQRDNPLRQTVVFWISLLWLGIMIPVQAEAMKPEVLLRQITDQMINRLNQEKTRIQTEPEYVYQLVEEVLVPHADFNEMSKRVLARNWRPATAEQRTEFEQAFKILVIRTYATAFRKYRDEKVEFVGERYGRNNKNLVEINTLVKQTEGPDIEVNYRLIAKGQSWKVYDMNVEGVSLVKSFRSQFNETIRKEGLSALITQIKQKNKAKEELE